MATIKGRIRAISISAKKGSKKTNVPEAELKMDFGIVGDAHAGNWHRQVSLLAVESIDKMIVAGATVSPGNFAENITTEGIELPKLPIGSRLKIGGGIELEVTQIGKECHSRCEIFKQVGDCIMP
ncbi:MAG TPA: MOSC domain-containing protein, partial [Phycisphaerales bacterium]|nr:MOSC domain-containing protein [Phycisphaerales bacterium]